MLRKIVLLFFCVLVSSACAHRNQRVKDAEVERALVELATRGEAEVKTEEGVDTNLHRDETVTTVSGDIPLARWVASNCEPSGICHFGNEGITVERVDRGASTRRAVEISVVGLAESESQEPPRSSASGLFPWRASSR